MRKQNFDRLQSGFTFTEHINGIDDFFQASVLVPLILIDNEYHLVFERRMPHIRQGGEICFPGGKIDLSDASPLAAALRETEEEIGYPPAAVTILGPLGTLILPTGMMIYAHLGILADTIKLDKLSKEEVESVFTLPLAFFLENEPEVYDLKVLIHPYLEDKETSEKQILLPVEELGLPAHYSQPWGNACHKIYVYHTEYGLIWGLTARIIRDYVLELKSVAGSD